MIELNQDEGKVVQIGRSVITFIVKEVDVLMTPSPSKNKKS